MANQPQISFGKAVKYWLFIIAVLVILFEMIASMVLFRKYTSGGLALAQVAGQIFGKKRGAALDYSTAEKLRPDSAAGTGRRIADETFQATTYVFEPWLQFRLADFRSRYVNISGFERRTVPAVSVNPASRDTLDIIFLGGASAFGYHLADAETIPSRFVAAYREKFPDGRSLRVRNYGVPHYYSKQELMLFTQLLFEGQQPDIAIFLDGLNDFYPSRMLYEDQPRFTNALQQTFDGDMLWRREKIIVDSTAQLYTEPAGVNPEQYYDRLLHQYLHNISQAALLSEKNGIKTYFFCEPVPFFRYAPRSLDTASVAKDAAARYGHIYTALEKKTDSLPGLVFLGNMLATEQEGAFIDSLHYSPEFSGKIARSILDHLAPELIPLDK